MIATFPPTFGIKAKVHLLQVAILLLVYLLSSHLAWEAKYILLFWSRFDKVTSIVTSCLTIEDFLFSESF